VLTMTRTDAHKIGPNRPAGAGRAGTACRVAGSCFLHADLRARVLSWRSARGERVRAR
jgi:hypothetical protein